MGPEGAYSAFSVAGPRAWTVRWGMQNEGVRVESEGSPGGSAEKPWQFRKGNSGFHDRRKAREEAPLDFLRDLGWVYLNLGRKVPYTRAPSSGARALWKWARGHEAEFFRLFLVKLMPDGRG